MKTAILNSKGLSIRDVDIPEPAENEVLVKMISCGICSGDLHLYQVRDQLDSDRALGHEVTGSVIKVGKNVSAFSEGDIVTSVDGTAGYSEYVIEDQHFFTPVPKAVSPKIALGEPIACCVHAMNRVHIDSQTKVAIVGCGFMGLICLQIAKAKGAQTIVAFDPVESRQSLATSVGADAAHNPMHYELDDIRVGEFDVVIEAAGVASALTFSSELVTHHGQLLLVGYHQSNDGKREVDVELWNYKAIDVINGHIRRMDEKFDAMQVGMEMVSRGDIDLKPYVQTYALENIAQAFEELDDRKSKLIKAVVTNEHS